MDVLERMTSMGEALSDDCARCELGCSYLCENDDCPLQQGIDFIRVMQSELVRLLGEASK